MRGLDVARPCVLLGIALLGGCVHRPAYAPWPSAASPGDLARKAPAQAKVTVVRFVHDRPDDQAKLDAIAVQLDRPVDPLTVSRDRFRLVGADRRVLVIEGVHLGESGAQEILLRGRFGDGRDDWAVSLAVFDGLYAADGALIAGQNTFSVQPPAKRVLKDASAAQGSP